METDASSLTEEQIDHILTQYLSGKITIGCAARMAGIPFQYSLDDLKEDYVGGRKLMHPGLSVAHVKSFRNR